MSREISVYTMYSEEFFWNKELCKISYYSEETECYSEVDRIEFLAIKEEFKDLILDWIEPKIIEVNGKEEAILIIHTREK